MRNRTKGVGDGPRTRRGDLLAPFWRLGSDAISCLCAPSNPRSLESLLSALLCRCTCFSLGRQPACKTLKKILPSTFKRLMWRNWLMSSASFSLGIRMPPALRQAVGIICFCHTTFISLQRKRSSTKDAPYWIFGDIPYTDIFHLTLADCQCQNQHLNTFFLTSLLNRLTP